MEKIKKCSRCKVDLVISLFYKNSSACKICETARRRELNSDPARKEKTKLYYLNRTKEQIDQYNKNQRIIKSKNRKKYNDKLKKWREANPNYKKNRWKNDLNYRVRENLRGRLYKAIKGFTKSKNTLDLLGCSVSDLKVHLEASFDEKMNWNNYGKWHIDHIKPCKLFDLSKESEQITCFHFSNLQPLWAKDNLEKGTNYKK
jgi:hypothetical protein